MIEIKSRSRSRDIIILLGAGASVDAGIPSSQMMINDIEEYLDTADWGCFRDLYHQIRAGIHYAAGIKGKFRDTEVLYNIETLVNTLYELERNEEHPIYPFIAAWNSRMITYAGSNFENVRAFRKTILEALKGWVHVKSPSKAEYYSGLKHLQNTLQFPLKVFSLNYDLCVESLAADGFRVETGFAGIGEEHRWEWKRFDETDPDAEPPEMYLYKMHGSTNWKRDGAGNLVCVNYAGDLAAEDMQVIFGRDFKLEAADPYLFYAFEFRVCSLDARIIVSIGYGFGDEHINKMLSQALRSDPGKRLLVVANIPTEEKAGTFCAEVASRLRVQQDPTSIAVLQGSAKDFLKRSDIGDEVRRHLPQEVEAEF